MNSNDSWTILSAHYVSRETKYKRRRPTIKKEVMDKLKLCKDIVSVDSKRAAVELDEILKLLS